jgi:cytochrome c oxidase assembly factor CtaG
MLATSLWTAWSAPPLVLAAAALSVGFFVHGWRRLRRRGRADHASWGRLLLFLAAVGLITLAIASPLDAIGEEYLQSAHMLQHVLIADLGVALAVLALRGPMTFFFLPRDVLSGLARMRRLVGVATWLRRPRNAVSLWVAVAVVWHLPPFYELALESWLAHDLQHVSFVLAGVLLWTVLLDPARSGDLTVAERVGVAVLVFAVGQLLAYVLVFGFEPYYDPYVEQEERLFGLSPLTDQRLAGVVMMVEQALTIGAFILWHLRAAARPSEVTS